MDLPFQAVQDYFIDNFNHQIACHLKDGYVHTASGEELGADSAIIDMWSKLPLGSVGDNDPFCSLALSGGTDRLVTIGSKNTEELRFVIQFNLFIPISRAEAPFGQIIDKADSVFKGLKLNDGTGWIYNDGEFPRNIVKVDPSKKDPYKKRFITYRMYKRYTE